MDCDSFIVTSRLKIILYFFILVSFSCTPVFHTSFSISLFFSFFPLYQINPHIQPENIVIKSFSRCEIKLIDFGSSCFTTDHLTSYIQSRSYRCVREVISCYVGWSSYRGVSVYDYSLPYTIKNLTRFPLSVFCPSFFISTPLSYLFFSHFLIFSLTSFSIFFTFPSLFPPSYFIPPPPLKFSLSLPPPN